MNRETLYISDEVRIKALENKIDELTKIIMKLVDEKYSIGDWWPEDVTIKMTALGKTNLYLLRKEGKIRSSNLTERKIWYRKSDFEKLLNKNQV